jgi:tetratricopeptide (TPR) repeat protein
MKIPVLVALVAFAVSTVDAGAAERFRPAASDYVVLRVPARAANDPIAILEQRYERAPDEAAASELAALYVERAREQREARYFGRAEMLLQPWLAKGGATGPALGAALRVQADILQNRHDFAGALQLLDRAVEQNSRDAGARLMRASVKVVQGHSAAARADCAAVLADGASVAGTVCLAEVLGNTGQLAQAEAILKSVVVRDEATSSGSRAASSADGASIADAWPSVRGGSIVNVSPSARGASTIASSSALAPATRSWALWLLADLLIGEATRSRPSACCVKR